MEDNPTFNLKFVQIVERYPVLYDYTRKGYSNRQLQEKTWNAVGNEVNQAVTAMAAMFPNDDEADVPHQDIWLQQYEAHPDFGIIVRQYISVRFPGRWIGREELFLWPPLSPDLGLFKIKGAACKEKWKNLRCAYTRYLRHRTPSGVSPQAKKKYYLADSLAFLTPFTKSRKSPMDGTEETSDEEFAQIKQPPESELQDDNRIAPSQIVEESVKSEYMLIPESSQTRDKVSVTKRKEIDPLETCAIDYFNPKKRCQVETTEDADLLFLKSLLPDLRRMTNAQKHEFKSKTIQNIGDILYTSQA